MPKNKPSYVRVMDGLKDRIKDEEFDRQTPFTTEEKVTQEYDVSRITAIRALKELEKEGIIYRKQGSGSFVTKNAKNVIEGKKIHKIASPKIDDDGKARLVALVLPFNVHLGGMMECFKGINEVFNSANCYVNLFDSERSFEKEAEILKSLLERNIDAVICNPIQNDRNIEIYNQFMMNNVPIVLIDKYIENFPISYVVSDNFGGASMLCEYAIKQGRKKIGFISQAELTETSTIKERYLGYTTQLVEHGMETGLNLVKVGLKNKTVPEQAHENMIQAMDSLIDSGVDAVMCQNDWVALEFVEECERKGVRIPEEILVLGFDNLTELNKKHGSDKIVTVKQDFYEMGVRAGKMILKALNDKNGMCIRNVVPVTLVDRTKGKEI